MLQGHTAKSWGGRGGERKRTWRESGALPLIGSKVGVLRVLQVHCPGRNFSFNLVGASG